MIKLTRPDGKTFECRPEEISLMNPDDSQFMGGKTIVRIDGENHGVKETVSEIDKLMARAQ